MIASVVHVHVVVAVAQGGVLKVVHCALENLIKLHSILKQKALQH